MLFAVRCDERYTYEQFHSTAEEGNNWLGTVIIRKPIYTREVILS